MMSGHRFGIACLLVLLALCVRVSAVDAALISFSDGFEGSSLNPFWTTHETSGFVTFPSTARVHSGKQSVQLNTTATGVDKFVSLEHTFAQPVYGEFSVWVYDTGAGVASSNYIEFELDRVGTNQRASIFGTDYDFGGGYQLNPDNSTTIASGVARTQGWHEFQVDLAPAQTTFKIDGLTVLTEPGAPLDHVVLFLGGPSWRPAWNTSFDDFSFVQTDATTPTPAPSTMVLLASGLCVVFGVRAARRLRRLPNLLGTALPATVTATAETAVRGDS